MWIPPVPFSLVPTSDSDSFRSFPVGVTGIPIDTHCGAFGVVRTHHTHEGVDLYVPRGTPVSTVEAGVVVAVVPFTGPHAGTPWWLDTWAVLVEGESGVVVYGEIAPHVTVGQTLGAKAIVGVVIQVLRHDKGRPTSMLHLEYRIHGSRSIEGWYNYRPTDLLDPTALLLTGCNI
jgi:murein DD-endopeptidase MepM/ murein hydrolase activator NlpD